LVDTLAKLLTPKERSVESVMLAVAENVTLRKARIDTLL
jgi:hypothetical protein